MTSIGLWHSHRCSISWSNESHNNSSNINHCSLKCIPNCASIHYMFAASPLRVGAFNHQSLKLIIGEFTSCPCVIIQGIMNTAWYCMVTLQHHTLHRIWQLILTTEINDLFDPLKLYFKWLIDGDLPN